MVASASSGLAVTLTLDGGSAATLTETNTLANVGQTGTVTIRANQPGNSNYLAAAEVVASLDVAKINQTLDFAAIGDQVATSPPVMLSATASSGLDVTFTVLSGPATVSSNVLTLTGAGTVVVQAAQAGNTNYNPTASVNRSFLVTAAASQITWSDLPAKAVGDEPFALGTVSSSGLPVTYTNSGTNVAVVVGNQVAIVGAGTCTITASDAGNSSYASVTVDHTLTVSPGTPVLSLPTASGITLGQSLADSTLTGGSASLGGVDVPGTYAFADPAATPGVGVHTADVIFTPMNTANYNTVTGSVNVTVGAAATTTALGSSANPSVAGDWVTFTATVSPSDATGTVVFKDGIVPLATNALNAGQAAFATAALAIGTHPITTEYSGDDNYLGSVSSPVSQVVNRANQPPTVTNYVAGTLTNTPTTIALAKLLKGAKASDPDGDTVVVSAVSPSSMHGGQVALQTTTLTYAPPTGYSGADAFDFTVSDGHGGTATAQLLITVREYNSSATQLGLKTISGGWRFSFAGVSGRTYRVQRAPAADGPWADATSILMPASGMATYDDTNPPPGTGFYRAVNP